MGARSADDASAATGASFCRLLKRVDDPATAARTVAEARCGGPGYGGAQLRTWKAQRVETVERFETKGGW